MRTAGLVLCLAAFGLALAGCATPQAPPPPPDLFLDGAFSAPAKTADADRLFALSPAMRDFLAAHPELNRGAPRRERALLLALQKGGALRLDYDAMLTRNAAQAFDARAGNCLSLVVMTAAFAQAMAIDVHFQQVEIDENWSRHGGLFVAAAHVDLVLGPRAGPIERTMRPGEDTLVVDFLPPSDLAGRRVRPIDEHTVVAMYLNNRAAESLVTGTLADAYAFAREAIARDPDLATAYNTLGVIYARSGHPDTAVIAFQQALQRSPDDLNLMANLAGALRATGDLARADVLAAELARRQPDPPFAFFERGLAAYRAGQWAQARSLFAREIERDPDNDEFHFWLAVADARLGLLASARDQLAQALRLSTRQDDRALYAAKLERLRALR